MWISSWLCGAFENVDHGALYHKLWRSDMTGEHGVWFIVFKWQISVCQSSRWLQLCRISCEWSTPWYSFRPFTFFYLMRIMMRNTYDIAESDIVSFVDDTRVYRGVSDTSNCDTLQKDLDTVYKWASNNNMSFNYFKFKHTSSLLGIWEYICLVIFFLLTCFMLVTYVKG